GRASVVVVAGAVVAVVTGVVMGGVVVSAAVPEAVAGTGAAVLAGSVRAGAPDDGSLTVDAVGELDGVLATTSGASESAVWMPAEAAVPPSTTQEEPACAGTIATAATATPVAAR